MSLPEPVTRKRFLAPEWVFIFGMVVRPFLIFRWSYWSVQIDIGIEIVRWTAASFGSSLGSRLGAMGCLLGVLGLRVGEPLGRAAVSFGPASARASDFFL